MSTWRLTIQSLAEDLATRPAIPPVVVQLFEAVADVEPSAIVPVLDSGELGKLIRSLDPTSLQLAIEFAAELRAEFEGTGAFEEAAAIDLMADRLQDELTAGTEE